MTTAALSVVVWHPADETGNTRTTFAGPDVDFAVNDDDTLLVAEWQGQDGAKGSTLFACDQWHRVDRVRSA